MSWFVMQSLMQGYMLTKLQWPWQTDMLSARLNSLQRFLIALLSFMECYGLPEQVLHALSSSWQKFQGD